MGVDVGKIVRVTAGNDVVAAGVVGVDVATVSADSACGLPATVAEQPAMTTTAAAEHAAVSESERFIPPT